MLASVRKKNKKQKNGSILGFFFKKVFLNLETRIRNKDENKLCVTAS